MLPAVPAADRPATPGTGPATDVPAAAADGPADTGWFQPAVESSLPYKFPSTGSVRLLPVEGNS